MRCSPGVYNMSLLQYEGLGPFSIRIVAYHTARRFWSRFCCALHQTPCREGRLHGCCGRIIFVHNLSTPDCEEPKLSSAGIACINRARRLCSRCWRAGGMHPLERRLFRHVRCSPSVDNLPLQECEEPVPNSAGIVCPDHAGRLGSRCQSAL